MIYKDFDWQAPDYRPVYAQRTAALARIRKQPERVVELKAYYRDHIADFINDWGVTFDPRNITKGLPAVVPFVLFPKQREFCEWFVHHWRTSENGLCDKSRDGGVSWLCMGIVCSLAALNDGFVGGFGSRKASYVDNGADPKSLFWKGREFMQRLPREFRAGWTRDGDAQMRMTFPDTNSAITGEAGDNIGRGDRTSVHVVDEAAHLEHPDQVDAALSETTLCRIDVSSVKGMANSFAKRRHSWAPEHVFTFHWRDDPRKNDEWYEKRKRQINNEMIVAQELDIDYHASAEGVLIPSEWIQASIDAHVKLGIHPSGLRAGALDVADEGVDLNAFCGAHGIVVECLEQWSGKGGDISTTTGRAFLLCDKLGYRKLYYDGDGIGAGVRGAAREANERRGDKGIARIDVAAYRGTSEIIDPDKQEYAAASNGEFFASYNAQQWWRLRTKFEMTFRAVVRGEHVDLDNIISIPKGIQFRQQLCDELAQIQWDTPNGAIKIEKTPEGMSSPNMADALKIRFAQYRRGVVVPEAYKIQSGSLINRQSNSVRGVSKLAARMRNTRSGARSFF